MAYLEVHSVEWCAAHGHPALVLRSGDGRFVVIAIGAEDAANLAHGSLLPHGRSPSFRLLTWIELLIPALGARLREVWAHPGDDGLLRATCVIEWLGGITQVSTDSVDAVALAQRFGIPVQIADEDLDRVVPGQSAARQPGKAPTTIPVVFRQVIETLDLDGLDRATSAGAADSSVAGQWGTSGSEAWS